MKFTNHPAFLAHQDALPIVFRQATFGLDTESTPISLLHLDHGLELDFGKATAKPVTLSFWVRSSLTGTHAGAVLNGTAVRSYTFTYTISAANTWEYKTVTVPGDTAGTWAVDQTSGLVITFNLGTGSTYAAAAGSWTAGTFTSVPGAVSVVGTLSATFYITGVQLEAGSTATAFERRLYGQELALCQRYYEAIGMYQFNAYGAAAENIGTQTYFKVTKRATPVIVQTNNSVSNCSTTTNSINISTSGYMHFRSVTALGGAFYQESATANSEL
jgi:hypothetical protein